MSGTTVTSRAPAGTETNVARLVYGVIAVAVADDAFWHVEPGVARSTHLVSGLLPVALGVLAGVLYPRMRPGARGSLALAAGALAITAGVADGVRHIVVDGVAGDDVTATAGAIAGVALLALGTRTLWYSRRSGGPRRRRYARRAAHAAIGVVAAWLVVLPAGVAIVATHKARQPVAAADLGRPYERVSLTTVDGLRLHGWYVPSRNRAAVIAFPGRSGPAPHARMLARHGYGVLLLDRRGEGDSDGELNLYGWNGERDLRAAISFLRARPDVDPARIGGLGLSVGGELMLQAAAHSSALRAVVSEGAGVRSLAEHRHTPALGAAQRWITPWVVQTAAVAVLSDTTPPADLVDLVRRIAPRPVLLIRALHGNPDEVLNRTYADALPSATLWELRQGGHTGGLGAEPGEYERRVVGFFDSALLR
jgi:uncharacterized protein